MKFKALIFAALILLGGLSSCSYKTCATYAKNDKAESSQTTDTVEENL
ncbi:MAG: hypothetical protein JJT94_05910 [Bernardetiaceae bacterium]|nr:hypothetical protein [Bernardetiaceae bacterium]